MTRFLSLYFTLWVCWGNLFTLEWWKGLEYLLTYKWVVVTFTCCKNKSARIVIWVIQFTFKWLSMYIWIIKNNNLFSSLIISWAPTLEKFVIATWMWWRQHYFLLINIGSKLFNLCKLIVVLFIIIMIHWPFQVIKSIIN